MNFIKSSQDRLGQIPDQQTLYPQEWQRLRDMVFQVEIHGMPSQLVGELTHCCIAGLTVSQGWKGCAAGLTGFIPRFLSGTGLSSLAFYRGWPLMTTLPSFSTWPLLKIIVLLPKKDAHLTVENWRPISLLTTFYKIIAKVLADCIAPFMDSWMFPEQRGFIRGRCILDNLMLVREAKAYVNRTKTPVVFMALDFSKAYDRVSRKFLQQCLQQYGFGSNFWCWVSILCEEAGAKVIVNGDMTQQFVRQGCPLAPLLFVLLTDFLA